MKAFLRVFSVFVLCAMLFTMTLWKNDAFPDLSNITAFVRDTVGRLNTLSEITGQGGSTQHRPTDNGAQFPEYTLAEELDPALEAAICNALATHAEAIDLSTFHLRETDLQAVISEIRFTHPEIFYVDKNFSYQTNSGYITELRPSYLYDAAETQVLMTEYRAMIAAIVAQIPQGSSDFEKLLFLHDHFVQNYSYDNTYTIRDAYTFFKQKTGVCQAYMLALIAVTEEIGIESLPVTSSRMNHAWNLVKLDGDWYHVDITWDDAVSYPSYTSYDYFLQSDAGLIAIDAEHIDESAEEPDWHCDWAATQSATNIKYDGAVWRGAHTPMVSLNGTYYCVVSENPENSRSTLGAVYSGSDPAALSKLFAVNGVWREGEHSYYVDCFAGLALYNGELIYNTNNTLRAHDLTTGEDRLVGFLDIASNESIFGICGITQTGVISCTVAPAASGESYRIVSCQI